MQQGRMLRERERLQEVVERVNWVYAGLWKLSRDHRSVVWADGYYHGPPVEGVETLVPSSAPLLQRRARRRVLEELQFNSTGLITMSNLSNTEWFYLASSSFSFPLGSQGTPAKTLARGGFEWVCDAGEVNALTFSRSDLAKAAGMQTVLCLSVHGGVVELGTTSAIDQDVQVVHFVRRVFEDEVKSTDPLDPYLRCDAGSSAFPISRSSTPGGFSSSATVVSNCLVPNRLSSGGQEMATVSYENNNFHLISGQNSPLSYGNHGGASAGLQYLTFAPSLVNGLKQEQVTDSFQVQLNSGENLQQHQQSAAVGPWSTNLQRHMMHVGQPPLNKNTMLLANLKHKLASPFGGRQVLAAKPAGGSCMASLEQALFHPQAQLHASFPQSSLPVGSTGRLCSDLQAHLLKHEYTRPNDFQDNQQVLLHFQSPHLMQNLTNPETIGNTLSPCLSQAAPVMNTWDPPDVHRRAPKQRLKSGPKNVTSLGMRLLRVECSEAIAAKFPTILNDPNNKLVSHSGESYHLCVQDASTGLPSFPSSPAGGSSQQAQFFADYHGCTMHSIDQSWSSQVSGTISDEKEQEVEGGDCFSVWQNGGKIESSGFLEGFSTRCSKRARGLYEETNHPYHGDGMKRSLVNNLISQSLTDQELLAVKKKYQSLRAMVQKNSQADKTSLLDDIVELVEELKENIKERESTTSSASDDSHDPNCLERSLSLTTSFIQENHVRFSQETSTQDAQHQYGEGEKGGSEGPNFPHMKLSDMSLDNGEWLDGVLLNVVDGIPQIEVRMMENKQVMIKLSSKDRPGLFADIMFALQDLHLQVQHANIRTISGVIHDVFAAKVDVLLAEKQTTSEIAAALKQAMQNGNSPSLLRTNPNINSPCKSSLQLA